MNNSFQQKRIDFAIEIRKNQRQKIIQDLRRKHFPVFPQAIPINDLIEGFELKDDPEFSKQKIQANEYIFVDIILARQQNLRRITFKNSVNAELVDEKLLPPIDSEFEIEEVPLPRQYPFKLQAALFERITDDMDKKPGKYKNLDKQIQKKLIDFLLAYLKRNTYEQTMREPLYHEVIINFLEFFVSEIESLDLRNRILKWVKGTDSLKLISRCLSGDFMKYHTHTKLYNIILTGLKHNKIETKAFAINVLCKCTSKGGDYDDIEMILRQLPQIFTELINYFNYLSNVEAYDLIYKRSEILTSVKQAARCIVNFMDTYEADMYNCLLEGAGYVGAWLIMENHPQLIEEGLHIFNILANIQDQQLSSLTISFLLHNSSIVELRVWQRLGQSYQIVRNQKQEIRRHFISFVTRLLSNAQFSDVMVINSRFRYPQNETLVDMLITMFIQHEDKLIRHEIIYCFQAIFFYGQLVDEQNMKIKDESEKDCIQAMSTNCVKQKILNSRMINIIHDLYENEYKHQLVVEPFGLIVGDFLSFLDEKFKFQL